MTVSRLPAGVRCRAEARPGARLRVRAGLLVRAIVAVALGLGLAHAPAVAQRAVADTSGFAEVRALLSPQTSPGTLGAEGDPDAALDRAEALLPTLLAGRDRVAASEALVLLGQVHRARGAYAEALTAAERAQLFADQSGETLTQGRAYRDLGEALRSLERYDGAAVHFGAAAQFYEEADEPVAQAAMLRAQSRAYLLAERTEQARTAALASVRLAERAGLRPEQAEGLRLVAALAAQQGDYATAYETLNDAEALQAAQLEDGIAAQRTDLEQSLLAALALREAERTRTDERVRDFIAAEQLRWRRQAALGIGALTLGAVGIALLVWGSGVWRRQRQHVEVRRRQRARARERQARGLPPIQEPSASKSPVPSSPGAQADVPPSTVAALPDPMPPGAPLPSSSPRAAPSDSDSPHTVTPVDAEPAFAAGPAFEAEPPLEDVAVVPSTPGVSPRDEEAGPPDTPTRAPVTLDAAERQRIAAAAAMAPEGFSARQQGPSLEGLAETEETGLALAALLLDQQLGTFSGDGIAVVDRGRVQGRAEVLRMLRHRVLRQGVEVDMQGFGEALRDYVLLRRGSLATGIEIAVEAPVAVRVRHAAPLGLIAYELLINAVEHAFVGRRSGRIDVQVRRNATHVTLTITDDGRGLPPGFSLERSGGEGLTFVRSLAGFLRAAVEVRSRTGTRWSVHVPLTTPVQPTMEGVH
ncbi:MAG: ATP-binding protein [Bacteroidota bacterium]